MDNIHKLALTLFILVSFDIHAAWTEITVDGQATGKYMRTNQYLQLNAQLGRLSGGYDNKLLTSSPNSSGGTYVSPVTTIATNPKIASNVKIPLSGAAGATVAAVLTAPILKTGIAKAAVALMRVSPYASAAMTFGWLANAGYQYLSSTDSFQTLATGTPTGSITGQCRGQTGTIILSSSTMDQCNSQWLSDHPTFTMGSPTKVDSCNYSIQYTSTNGVTTTRNPWWTNASPCTDDPNAIGSVIASASPATEIQVLDKLNTTPISGSVDTPTTINNELGELIKSAHIPELDPATSQKLTGPNGETQITQPGGESTTTTPDGNVTTRRLEYQTQFADDRAEIMEMLTETTTTPGGQTSTTTTTQPANVDQATASNQTPTEPQKTDCDKYPDSIGCSKYGVIPSPETITTVNVPLTLNPTSLGTGTCPADKTITLHDRTLTMSYQPYCNFATKINPLVIAFAWLAAGLIVLGPIREG